MSRLSGFLFHPVRTRISLTLILLSAVCLGALFLQHRYFISLSGSGGSKLYQSAGDCTCDSTKVRDDKSIKINASVAANRSTEGNQSLLNILTPAGVPMILHFVYKDTYILDAYRANIESCIRLNKNWTVTLWTDEAVKSFLSREYPQYQSVFYGFPHKIQRSDAVRYLILYSFGGVYMDLDMTCRQPLLTSLSKIPCYIDREREHQTQVIHGRQYSAMNSAMGCKPGHPFFKKLIEFVLHPDRLKGGFSFPYTIFETTGPIALTKHYDAWASSNSQTPVTLLNETFFSPKINPRSGVYGTCRNVLKSLNRNSTGLSPRDKACLDIERLGFEKSDEAFTTNLTVAIHEFTHLGYADQKTSKIDFLSLHPDVRLYKDLTRLRT